MLFAPGGASLSGRRQSDLGVENVEKNFMIFHADVNMAYFEHCEGMSQQESIRKGWTDEEGCLSLSLSTGIKRICSK